MQVIQPRQARHGIGPVAVLRITALVVFLLWTLIPVLLIVVTSFKRRPDIFTRVPRLVFQPTLENYTNDFVRANFAHYFLNSLIVASCTTLLSMALGTMAAYS